MTMLNRLKRWLANKSHDRAFPREVKEHWYCGAWFLHLGNLRDSGRYDGTTMDPPEIASPAEGIVAFNPWHTGHADRDTSGLIDGLIPAIRVGNRVGLYEQGGGKHGRGSFYDGLPWDDGYKINLRFVRSIEMEIED